jgi:type IV secretory pathway VirJ component
MINRLPAELQSKTRAIALLGPSPNVEFEFHVGDWMRSTSKKGFAVKPEVDKLLSHNIMCIYGEDDKDSLCPGLKNASVIKLKGAHHFDGGYEQLAAIILEHLQ